MPDRKAVHEPTSAADLARVVKDAFEARMPLGVSGAKTRKGLGRPVQAHAEVSSAKLSGITLYEPAELVIAAKAGTPVSEVVATLAAKGQRLPFEPMDHRGLYGTLGEPTVGGIAAGNVSGPARINLGAARDSMIGVKFVNGRGEDIVSGGRVMKNVTGLDFVKALAGSHGTLAVFHEICFKVLPLAEREATLVLEGLTDERAVEALSSALGSPFEPTGAAHLPAAGSMVARTIIRLEGVPASLAYRIDAMAKVWKPFGSFSVIESGASERLWRDVRDAAPVSAGDGAVWRLSVTPSKGPAIGASLKEMGARVFYDWGGGLIWASIAQGNDAGAPQIHAAAKAAGGYATLMRAKDPLRLAVDVFDPPAGPLMTMHKKLKASFDPAGILNPGRMYSGI